MQSQVKEFFNKLKRKYNQEKKPRKTSRNKIHRTLGILPSMNYNIPDINDFNHFMECEISPNICPMMWETLQVDFDNKNRRYCEFCEKYVYKADNEYMVKKLINENKCMAISNNVLEKMNGKMDKKRYENIEKRLIISKLFIYYKKYNPDGYYDMQKEGLSYEEQLKSLLLSALDHRDIEKYINTKVDMEKIYLIALENSNDEEFKKIVFDKINNYFEDKK